MLRYALMITTILVGSTAWADADVCAVRPDLCDSRPAQRAVRKEAPKRRQATITAPARPRPVANRAKTKNCRPKGASFSLNSADLPACNSEAAVDADDALYENVRNPMRDRIVQPSRAANRSPANSIDVDAYLMANANHPAFANRTGSRQVAFERTEKPAVMIMPSLDGGVGTREDTTTASNPGH